jgi:four helix bundle protein
MKTIHELGMYNLAENLSDMIWSDFETWSDKVQRTIGFQIIRASDSIAANIAEGYSRFTPLDRKKFYRYSRGSFEETKAWLRKLFQRKIVSPTTTNRIH